MPRKLVTVFISLAAFIVTSNLQVTTVPQWTGLPSRHDRRPFHPLAAALDAVGDRWTLLLVEALLDGPRRFGDLQFELPGIAPNVPPNGCAGWRARVLPLALAPTRSARSASSTSSPSGRASWGASARPTGGPATARAVRDRGNAACGTPVRHAGGVRRVERPVEEDEAMDPHFAKAGMWVSPLLPATFSPWTTSPHRRLETGSATAPRPVPASRSRVRGRLPAPPPDRSRAAARPAAADRRDPQRSRR